MPVPFKDQNEITELGHAAFLKIVSPNEMVYQGSLFFINAKGEPVEFCYNKIKIPDPFLWKKEDLFLHAARKLVLSLFSVAISTPKILFCLAPEIPPLLFGTEIEISVSVCRVENQTHLFWFPGLPSPDSEEEELFECLKRKGLLLEPFERARAGLKEIYKDS